MNKNIYLLAVLAVSSVLYAQENKNFDGQDLLAAFEQYNPAVLQKAQQNEIYQDILQKLTAVYNAPRTDESETEMIALAMNFDNSIRLEMLRQAYNEGRTLQRMSGTNLEALEQGTLDNLVPVVQDIFKNTLAIKKIQIKRYKSQLKNIKKDASLSPAEKDERVTDLKNRITRVKQEIRALKTNSKKQIQDAATVYLIEARSAYDAALSQEQQAQASSARDVKANNKKPVAK